MVCASAPLSARVEWERLDSALCEGAPLPEPWAFPTLVNRIHRPHVIVGPGRTFRTGPTITLSASASRRGQASTGTVIGSSFHPHWKLEGNRTACSSTTVNSGTLRRNSSTRTEPSINARW